MSTMERARSFMRRSTLSTVMSVLPFALAAVNADAAAVTLTPGLYTPTVYTNGMVDLGSNFYLLPSVVGDVDGQKIAGVGTFAVIGDSSISAQDLPSVQIVGYGGASGTFTGDNLPVKWDFSTSEQFSCLGSISLCSSTAVNSSWLLEYTLWFGDLSQKLQFTNSGFGNFTGTSAFTGVSGLSPTAWEVALTVYYSGYGNLIVDIPENSLAIPGTSAVPEPATIALMGAGLVFIGLRRIRRS